VYRGGEVAGENGKAKSQAVLADARPALKESERSRPGLEKYFPPGPWTEEDERFFQIMIKEFGGAPERDSDL
jgi:hypothetical protein